MESFRICIRAESRAKLPNPDSGMVLSGSEQMNLRKLAQGQDCQVRLAGISSSDPATVVLASRPSGGTCGTRLSRQMNSHAGVRKVPCGR